LVFDSTEQAGVEAAAPRGPDLAPLLLRKQAVPFWNSFRSGKMETWHFVWMLAALTGLTAAGLAGSGWAMVTGERPNIWILSEYSVATPLRVLALVVYAPMALVKTGLGYLAVNPILALMIFVAGMLWSFMQGVFIMVTFFGFT
jgi:hypothetical protein